MLASIGVVVARERRATASPNGSRQQRLERRPLFLAAVDRQITLDHDGIGLDQGDLRRRSPVHRLRIGRPHRARDARSDRRCVDRSPHTRSRRSARRSPSQTVPAARREGGARVRTVRPCSSISVSAVNPSYRWVVAPSWNTARSSATVVSSIAGSTKIVSSRDASDLTNRSRCHQRPLNRHAQRAGRWSVDSVIIGFGHSTSVATSNDRCGFLA